MDVVFNVCADNCQAKDVGVPILLTAGLSARIQFLNYLCGRICARDVKYEPPTSGDVREPKAYLLRKSLVFLIRLMKSHPFGKMGYLHGYGVAKRTPSFRCKLKRRRRRSIKIYWFYSCAAARCRIVIEFELLSPCKYLVSIRKF